MRKRYLFLALTAISSYLLSISITSCEKATINLGSDFVINSPTTLVYIDTLTTQISTVYVDSFVTSAPVALLIGNYTDPFFGAVSCRSFLQVGLATGTIPSGSVYDSTEVVLRYNTTYCYGDTTKPFTITLNQLASPVILPPSQTYFYNKDTLGYNPTPAVLGSTQLSSVRPNIIDTLAITLNGDSTGINLFNQYVTGGVAIQNQPQFLNYFKGFAISGSNGNSFVGGFNDTVEMRLHYHTPGISNTYTYLSFKMVNPLNEFNNITVNRTGTAIAGLSITNNVLPSSATGNAGYDQYTTGSMVKISFPYLQNLLLLPNFVKIIKATLLVKPVRNSFSQQIYPLPPKLVLAQTDINNGIGADIPGGQTGNLFIDGLAGIGTAYTYDLTAYLQSLMPLLNISTNSFSNSSNNSYGYGLLLLLPNQTSILNRIVVGDMTQPQNYTTEVQIYYAAVQ
jgi:hypothetical protein